MEERQLIKLKGWFKSWHISCLKIAAKNPNELLIWILIKEQSACLLKKILLQN
jgi:hypothetical protein